MTTGCTNIEPYCSVYVGVSGATNIVIEMHYHPSLNRGRLMEMNVRLSMPGTVRPPCQDELAAVLPIGANSLWLQQRRTCVRVGVSLHCHSSDSLHHKPAMVIGEYVSAEIKSQLLTLL